jgi:hypothetical protein
MSVGSTRDLDDGIFTAAANEFDGDVNEELRARVKAELEPGERLLWESLSHPPRARIGAGILFLFATALVFLFFGVMAVGHSFGHVAPDGGTMPLGIFLCTAGCLFLLGATSGWYSRRVERRDLSRVCYAVTDRRIVVWVPDSKQHATRVYTVPKGQVKNLVRVERASGFGDLEFSSGADHVDFRWYPFGFKHIPEVRRVEQIIRNNLMSTEQDRSIS